MLMISLSFNSIAQDVHSSITYLNPVKMNPAFTGLFEGKMRVWYDGRLQFSPNHFSPETNLDFNNNGKNMLFVYHNTEIGADFSFTPSKGKAMFGAGFNLLKDESGQLHITRYKFSVPLGLSFQPKKGKSDWYLAAGLQPNLYFSSIDVTNMTTASQYYDNFYHPDASTNEKYFIQEKTPMDIDFNAGVSFVYIENTKGKKLKPYQIVSLTINHIHPFNLSYFKLKSEDDDDNAARYTSISYSGLFNLRDKDKYLQLQNTLNYYRSSFRTTPCISLYVLKVNGKKIYFPVGLQFDFVRKFDNPFDFDAITFVFRFMYESSFDAAISYDIHFTELKKLNHTPELLLIYRFLNKQNTHGKILCPGF